MKAYIVCIGITLIINLLATLFINKKNKIVGIVLLSLSLFIICFIAGVRDTTVGADVNGYVKRLTLVSESSPNFFVYMKNAGSDFLFSILVYFSYLSRNINVTLGIIELAVSLPIYIYAYINNKKTPVFVTILIFLLTMYCTSLNNMRQSIAISLSILSYYFYDELKKKKTAYFILFLAILFHRTAIVMLVAILINKIIKNDTKFNKKQAIIFIFIIITLLSPLLEKIVSNSYYSYYLNNENSREFSIGTIIKKTFFVAIWAICLIINKDKGKRLNITIGLIISILSLYCAIMSFIVPGLGRLGYYFTDLMYFLLIDYIPSVFKQKKIIAFLLIIVLSILWWKMTKVEDDPAKVYPYSSSSIQFLNEEWR